MIVQIIFCKGKNFLSNVIAQIDGGDSSHVAIASDMIGKGSIIAHSTSRGVHIDHANTFLNKYEFLRSYRLKVEDEENKFLSLLATYADRPYDYFGLLYLGFYKIGFLQRKENIWQNRNFYICTEFVSIAAFDKVISTYGLVELEAALIEMGVEQCS